MFILSTLDVTKVHYGVSAPSAAGSSQTQFVTLRFFLFLSGAGGRYIEAGSQLWQVVCHPAGPHPGAQHRSAVLHG